MAVNGLQPFIKVTDSNGDPIVGAKLYVYEAETTTERAIYSDDGLSIPMTNPLQGVNASNASGDFPRFYMAAGLYKLRAETSTGTLIWEYDNIDSGTSAGAGALPIANGGTGATTAAAARSNLDVPSNSELAALSATIAAFTASLQNIVSSPQGRLTPTSNTPVITASALSGTAVYYTPHIGNLCPVYDGTQFNLKIFTELTLTLTASYVLNSIYDVFLINDSGTIRIVTGPAWSTITAGSGARGTGAGTTELTRLSGLFVNAYAMATARNGASTYSVAANQGTYLGSIYIDGTAGQISCNMGYGQSRKWSVWNAYNRTPIVLQAGDATATWTYNTNTIRASNGAAANSLTVFSGLPEEGFRISFNQAVQGSATGASSSIAYWQTGIGWNSTTAFSGQKNTQNIRLDTPAVNSDFVNIHTGLATFDQAPAIGINTATALETTTQVLAANAIYQGGNANMLLRAEWRG